MTSARTGAVARMLVAKTTASVLASLMGDLRIGTMEQVLGRAQTRSLAGTEARAGVVRGRARRLSRARARTRQGPGGAIRPAGRPATYPPRAPGRASRS